MNTESDSKQISMQKETSALHSKILIVSIYLKLGILVYIETDIWLDIKQANGCPISI